MAIWAIPRTNTFRQGIRVLAEGTEEELFRFGSHSIPRQNEEISYYPEVGDPIDYKVESVRYVVKEEPESPDFESYIAVLVSTV